MYKVGDIVIGNRRLVSITDGFCKDGTELKIANIRYNRPGQFAQYTLKDDAGDVYICGDHCFSKEIVGLFYYK